MSIVRVSGDLVCDGTDSIRDEIASLRPNLMIGGEMSGLFVNGSAQCGDCGKLHEMGSYLSLASWGI